MRVSVPAVLTLVLAAGVVPAAGQPGIAVVVNGVPVSLAAPALMQAGQVLVPAVRTFEAFGAAAVWQAADRAVMVTNRTGIVVRLRIGEPTAWVNGEPRSLPVAALLIGDQPYVPAAFVFAALGAWVRLDEPSRTLHVASQITTLTLRREDGVLRVVLDATGPLRAETRTLSNPDRLVVDLHGGAFRPQDQDLPVGEAGVLRVRAGQFQVKPYITRVVFDLQQPVDVRTQTSTDSFAYTIEVRPRGQVLAGGVNPQAATPAGTGAQPQPPSVSVPPSPAGEAAGPVYTEGPSTHEQVAPIPEPLPDDGVPRIQQVRVEQLGTRFRVLIEGTAPADYTVRELVDPDRLVVDLQRAIFLPVKQEIPVAGAVVTEVRAAQFNTDPDVVRVVVVLRRKAAYAVAPAPDAPNVLVIEIPDVAVRAHLVTIDAGHGGRDTGAIGPTGLLEKDVVLDIAQRVRELLVRAGIRAIMTREADVFVELADRPRVARQQGATVFVSIHANASTRPSANGSETYYLTPQSQVLAQMVQEELSRVPGLISRGTKTANFLVLRESDVPAVLVEVAYISNVDEEARLRQSAFRQRLAEAVGRGVQRFLAVYPVPAH